MISPENKTFVTFGQTHVHRINGKTVDCDCVVIIPATSWAEGRAKAFEYFGDKFAFEYFEQSFPMNSMKYYPRGFIFIESEEIQNESN